MALLIKEILIFRDVLIAMTAGCCPPSSFLLFSSRGVEDDSESVRGGFPPRTFCQAVSGLSYRVGPAALKSTEQR
jgi:hypothetical protein